MAIKLILLDLDGTMLTSGKEISPRTYTALAQAAAQGVHIVPSTGRFFDGMPQVVRDLPFVRYAVTINGAQVYDRAEDRILRREEIAPPQAEAVYDQLDQLPVIYDCFLDGWGYMDQRNYDRIDQFIADPRVNNMVKTLRKPVADFRAFMREQNRPVQKIQMFFQDMDLRQGAWWDLAAKFPSLAVTSSITNNLEINAGLATKGEALRFLCQYLGIDVQGSMAFGDSSNDMSMILAAGTGVAMGNADQDLQAAADYVTDINDSDGVAKAIEKFVLSV